MWTLVSLYLLAHVAAGLIEAGFEPSRPRGFRVFDCLGSPYMNNFRSCATFSHRRSARMGLFGAHVILVVAAGIPSSYPAFSFGPPLMMMILPASSGPRLRPRGVILIYFACLVPVQ
jgi:hypothetical protein